MAFLGFLASSSSIHSLGLLVWSGLGWPLLSRNVYMHKVLKVLLPPLLVLFSLPCVRCLCGGILPNILYVGTWYEGVALWFPK